MDKSEKKKALKQLVKLWMIPKSPVELEKVLEDFLTTAEISALNERWQTVDHLLRGKPQREVSQVTGVSISKVTRAAQVLRDGTGGFELVWNRLKSSKSP